MYKKRIVLDSTSGWRNSRNVCALSDGDRHLGHIVLTAGRWHAYDATHVNEDENGYVSLGVFPSVTLAKAAVEGWCARDNREKSASTAGSMWIC
jgi:hypothetical protein